jgi:hypothetical protein
VEEPAVRLLRRIAVLIFLLTLLSPMTFAQQLPEGWRRPTQSESSGEWRKKSSTRFLVARGDFDEDGKPDVAELRVNRSMKQFALFVRLSSAQKWQLLNKPYSMADFDRFGIANTKPGKYETACGKGYGDYACAHGEPDWLKLTRPAIDFFYTESSDSVFYWDAKLKQFKEVLISD